MEAILENMQKQMELQERNHREQLDAMMSVMKEMKAPAAATPSVATVSATPNFASFDSSAELWEDHWSRFVTFFRAYSVSEERQAQVFLTNQSPTIYKMISNLAAQSSPSKQINELSIKEIVQFMRGLLDRPKTVHRQRKI